MRVEARNTRPSQCRRSWRPHAFQGSQILTQFFMENIHGNKFHERVQEAGGYAFCGAFMGIGDHKTSTTLSTFQ